MSKLRLARQGARALEKVLFGKGASAATKLPKEPGLSGVLARKPKGHEIMAAEKRPAGFDPFKDLPESSPLRKMQSSFKLSPEEAARGGPVEIGHEAIPTEELARLAGMIGREPAIVFPGVGPLGARIPDRVAAAVRFPADEALFLNDKLGPYRRPEGIQVIVNELTKPEYVQEVLSHELGHAIVGVRDPEASVTFISRMFGKNRMEDMVTRELLPNQVAFVRRESWDLHRTLHKLLKENLASGEIKDPKMLAEVKDAMAQSAAFMQYMSRPEELLADGFMTILQYPERAKKNLPEFVDVVKALAIDPQLQGKVEFRALFPFLAAGASMLAYERGQTLEGDRPEDLFQ